MMPIVTAMSGQRVAEAPLEFVERKGLGHPDTICDALAEAVSRGLSLHYLERFGAVLHHNVDKMLLRGGQADAAFGGGTVKAPIEIYLAGRATALVNGAVVPVDEIAVAACRNWLRQHLRYVDIERHIHFHCLFRPGSSDLVDLFLRHGQSASPLANDSSFGAGHAPLSPLERIVLAVERALNASATKREFAALGDDIKVMGLRDGSKVSLTIAAAMVGAHTAGLDDYAHSKARVAEMAIEAARSAADIAPAVTVNAADNLESGSIYLTVTGTSADAGDDGQVGRGNRANGLITPYRPMTMEAIAGKNPINHVGKLYNILAHRLALAITEEVPGVIEAECYLAGRIGRPIGDPAALQLRLRTASGKIEARIRKSSESIALRHLESIGRFWESVLSGEAGNDDWPDSAADLFRTRRLLVEQVAEEFEVTRHVTGMPGMSARLRTALLSVPRDRFVAAGDEGRAYENRPLGIGHGQTISQPFIVALMTELLDLSPQDSVLEIGTGSGYQAAILSRLTERVCSIEVIDALAASAQERLRHLGFAAVEVRSGDGSAGWKGAGPFDKIIVTAAAPEMPLPLIAQLKRGGRMVVPVGAPMQEQMLMLITKNEHGAVHERTVLPVAFVPLRHDAEISAQ